MSSTTVYYVNPHMFGVWCVPLPPEAIVLKGMGMVCEFFTPGIPMPNPSRKSSRVDLSHSGAISDCAFEGTGGGPCSNVEEAKRNPSPAKTRC